MAEYRKKKGSDTWHFCRNCSRWPTSNFESKNSKPTGDELCDECLSKKRNGKCR